MNASEIIGIAGAALSFLLSIVFALIAWTFTTFRSDALRKIDTLTNQNRDQALAIKTLETQATHADKADSRLVETLEKLDDKIDGFSKELGRFGGLLDSLSRRLSGSSLPRQP